MQKHQSAGAFPRIQPRFEEWTKALVFTPNSNEGSSHEGGELVAFLSGKKCLNYFFCQLVFRPSGRFANMTIWKQRPKTCCQKRQILMSRVESSLRDIWRPNSHTFTCYEEAIYVISLIGFSFFMLYEKAPTFAGNSYRPRWSPDWVFWHEGSSIRPFSGWIQLVVFYRFHGII